VVWGGIRRAYLSEVSCGLMVEMCQRFPRASRTVMEEGLWEVENRECYTTTICQLSVELPLHPKVVRMTLLRAKP
jgi:hypothetical protein